jgi:hypothetical protein
MVPRSSFDGCSAILAPSPALLISVAMVRPHGHSAALGSAITSSMPVMFGIRVNPSTRRRKFSESE